MVNTFLKYLSIYGAILTIDFDDFFVKLKNYEKYQKKIDLTYLTSNFYCCFLHKKNPVGVSIHRRKESFPVKPSLILYLLICLYSAKKLLRITQPLFILRAGSSRKKFQVLAIDREPDENYEVHM